MIKLGFKFYLFLEEFFFIGGNLECTERFTAAEAGCACMHTVLPLASGKTFFLLNLPHSGFFSPPVFLLALGLPIPLSFWPGAMMTVRAQQCSKGKLHLPHPQLITIKHDIASLIHHLCISAFQSAHPSRERVLASWRKFL